MARLALLVLLRMEDSLTWCINKTAMAYEGGVHPKHRLTRYHDFFVDRITVGERVLDIGCGYGAVAFSVASRAGGIVTGIDLNGKNIERARAWFRHPNLNFQEGDALRDLPRQRFDTVILSNILEHIENRLDFLKGVQDAVGAKRWLIRVPMINRDWRVPLRRELGVSYYSDRTHFTEYTQETFSAEMESAGLVLVHEQLNWGEIWAEAHAKS